ncbi:hypothetical protein QTP86_033477, partial [Hemibagrus guttatus]
MQTPTHTHGGGGNRTPNPGDKKVTLSNVPLFISDDILREALSRHGKPVSSIKRIPIASQSPLLKHAVSFRRFVYMIVKDDAELDLTFHFCIDGFDYVVFTTTGKMRCLCCGKEGHLVTNCPDRTIKDSDTNSDDKISEQAVQRLAEVDQAEAHPVVEPLRERRGVDESAEAGSVSADNVDT